MKIGIKDVLYKIRWFFIPYLVIICACLVVKIIYTRPEIYYAVNSRYSPWADWLAPYFTDLGNGWTTVALAVLLVFFSYRKAFLMAVTYALVPGLVTQAVKYLFDSPRPKVYFQKELAHLHFVKGVEILSRHSFPSGHTVTAFSTALLITYWCKNKFWGLPLLVVACLVGYSRMYLSEHFFEDVTTGSVIAVISTVLLITWLDSREFLQSPAWSRGLLSKS